MIINGGERSDNWIDSVIAHTIYFLCFALHLAQCSPMQFSARNICWDTMLFALCSADNKINSKMTRIKIKTIKNQFTDHKRIVEVEKMAVDVWAEAHIAARRSHCSKEFHIRFHWWDTVKNEKLNIAQFMFSMHLEAMPKFVYMPLHFVLPSPVSHCCSLPFLSFASSFSCLCFVVSHNKKHYITK